MQVKRKINKEIEVVTAKICDICKEIFEESANPYLFQNVISISFYSGYASFFKDGTKVEIDMCERCFDKKLGKYLKKKRGE